MALFPPTTARLAVAAPLLALCGIVQATPTEVQVDFQASIVNCVDPSLNTSTSGTFTAALSSGTGTTVNVDFGDSLGIIPVELSSTEVQEVLQALELGGGMTSVSFGPEPAFEVGSGCDYQGTVTISSLSSPGDGQPLISERAPSNVVTRESELDTFARGQPVANSNRIRSVLKGEGSGVLAMNDGVMVTGMAAGGGGQKYGAWVGYSYANTKNDFVSTAFKSDRHSGLFGIDTFLNDSVLLGVSFGLESSSTDTRFNAGEQDVTAMTVAPYIGVLLTDWITFDASFGYSDVSIDQFRTAGATRVNSKVDSSRLFVNANVSAFHTFDSLVVTGVGGVLYARQDDDGFRESDGTVVNDAASKVGRLLFGAEVAYDIASFEPYVSGTFEYDFSRSRQQFAAGVAQPKNDNSDLLFAAGLRYFGNNGLTGSVEYSSLIGRRNLDENTISANVRWEF